MWKNKFVDVDLNETINFNMNDKCTFDELLKWGPEKLTKAKCIYVLENELSNWAILQRYGIDIPNKHFNKSTYLSPISNI